MIIKDLGAVSAYAYAVEKGYTGTEEEFAALMASYASVAEEAAESAESAQASATTASSAASTATTKASEASTAAQTATAKAEEAQADADAAALDASQALSAASTATTKASEAAQSASDAVTAKTAAQTAQTAAEGSATTAQTAAQTATQKAAEAAESARTLTIDTTLTQTGQAADAKVVGGLRDDLGGLDASENYKTMQNGYLTAQGTFTEHNSWRCTDYIPVCYRHLHIKCFSTGLSSTGHRFIWGYTEDKTPVNLGETFYTAVGSEFEINYTLPDNVAYIRFEITANNYSNHPDFQFNYRTGHALKEIIPLIEIPNEIDAISQELDDISSIVSGETAAKENITGDVISGKCYNNTTGAESTSFANANATAKIALESGYNYYFTGAVYNFAGGVCFYASDNSFISAPYTATGTYTDQLLTIPPNAAYITASTYNVNASTLKLEKQAQSTPNVRELAEKNKQDIAKLSIDIKKMHHIYVATTGDDVTGDGTQSNPFASIKHANESITDNSENNEYTIHVADGTYTDLQTLYAGTENITNYQGVICKNHVYYVGNIANPENVVIEWDGATGYTLANYTYNDYGIWKCPFHITHADNGGGVTAIRGMTLKCKNTRYALHIETSGKGKGVEWEVSDMRIVWNGTPDCTDKVGSYTTPAIGTGCGHFEKGRLLRCKVINAASYYRGFVNHDSRYMYGQKYAVREGADITIESCIFNGGDAGKTSITMRNIYEDGLVDGYNRVNIINCIGISTLGYATGASVTQMNWRALVRCSNIDTNNFATGGYLQ